MASWLTCWVLLLFGVGFGEDSLALATYPRVKLVKQTGSLSLAPHATASLQSWVKGEVPVVVMPGDGWDRLHHQYQLVQRAVIQIYTLHHHTIDISCVV